MPPCPAFGAPQTPAPAAELAPPYTPEGECPLALHLVLLKRLHQLPRLLNFVGVRAEGVLHSNSQQQVAFIRQARDCLPTDPERPASNLAAFEQLWLMLSPAQKPYIWCRALQATHLHGLITRSQQGGPAPPWRTCTGAICEGWMTCLPAMPMARPSNASACRPWLFL